MKSEKEIRKFRDDLYQSTIKMRKDGHAEYSLIMTHVRLLDFILNGKDNMGFDASLTIYKKFDWDSVLAGSEVVK